MLSLIMRRLTDSAVTGEELFVHGVKVCVNVFFNVLLFFYVFSRLLLQHADWLYSRKGDAADVKALKKQCMAHPQAWKPPIKPENIVSKAQMKRLVVRSDFEKTLDFPDR